MNRWLLVAVVGWGIAAADQGQAREYETLAVVSGAGVETLAGDLAFLGGTIQNPRLAENAGKALARQTSIESLDGLDPSRRWAVALRTDAIDIAPLLLLPVTSLNALLRSLHPILEEVEPQEDGLIKIGRGSLTGFVREQDGWAFVAQSAERLAELPDPEAILAETPADACLAMTLHVRRLPEAYRTMAIDNLRSTLRAANERRDGLPVAAGLFDADLSTQMRQLTEQGLSEAEQVRLAVRLDQETKCLALELRVRPRADSPLAAVVKEWGTEAEGWSELAKNDACRSRIDMAMDPETRASLSERWSLGHQAARRPDKGPHPPPATDDGGLDRWLSDLAAAALAPDRCRVDFALSGDRPPLTCAVRCAVADADAANRLVQTLQRFAKGRPPAKDRDGQPNDNATPRDVVRCPLVADDLPEPLGRLLGSEPVLLVAARSETIVLAAGPQAEKALAQAAKAGPARGAPLALVLRSGTAASLLGQLVQDDRRRTMATVAALNLRSADDRLSLLLARDGDELVARATAHEGILRTTAITIGIGVLQAMSAPPR